VADKFIRRISHKMRDISQVAKCDCANMDGHLCYVCLEKERDNWRHVATVLRIHLGLYGCLCNMNKCKCGYDEVLDLFDEAEAGSI
jgi:hypothetical protein